MTENKWEALLDTDWGDAWDSLRAAPDLVPRPKESQITLRLPTLQMARLKRVGTATRMPHHSLARSWIIEGLRGTLEPKARFLGRDEPLTEQLNIKLDQGILDEAKEVSRQLGRPYHRLAREWIEAGLSREEQRLGLQKLQKSGPPIKDLIVLLLHSSNRSGQDAVRGITRLQKLLFVLEQELSAKRSFYAFNYGPFSEAVNDAAEALKLTGFLRSGQAVSNSPPSFEDMMATVEQRSGPKNEDNPEEFELNDRGHEIAERLRRSNDAYEQLYARVRKLREEWDTPNLVERVYATYPEYTKRSLIKDEVARGQRRTSRQSHIK